MRLQYRLALELFSKPPIFAVSTPPPIYCGEESASKLTPGGQGVGVFSYVLRVYLR